MKPVVTVLGASGFIGSAVTAALSQRPVHLRAVARRPAQVPANGLADVEIRTADLTDPHALAEAVAGSDAVIHLLLYTGGWRAAAEDPSSEHVNVGVMRNLIGILEASREKGATGPPPLVVYGGAASQIGVPPDRPIDGTEPDEPGTVYDQQKLAAEQALMAATAAGTVRGVSLRLPTVFGHVAGTDTFDRGVVSTMIRKALAGEDLTMWHDGTVKRDLVHVDDVARAFLAALDHPEPLNGRHWLLGSGLGEELGAVFGTIADAVARHTGKNPVPVVSVTPPDHAPATDFRSVTIDSSRFRSVTGWAPEVPLRTAVERTIAALDARHTEGTSA
ncbi:NAD-dependent epimerase/dehydratase [Streptomyces sp. N2-109]|uniref:NAD-dependent epimerase/dehydratase n=1 Tax=Streptomyces gossypii TaxID=2883101 RepID=A0ABT2JP41_9ACTN|nr:NAD-dependent epimerase/dehydratase [Streptomyces gossypii]MCT2589591.1 NAD-dependent epimerase/dehydratase [Streptomyces gossypii]